MGGPRKFKLKQLSTTLPCTLHTWWHIVCMLGAPTSTSHVHCVTVEMYSKTRLASSACTVKYRRCHIRTLLGCLSACAQCTEVVTSSQCVHVVQLRLCCKLLVGLYSIAVDPRTAVSLTGLCCTQRLELLVSLFRASQRP